METLWQSSGRFGLLGRTSMQLWERAVDERKGPPGSHAADLIAEVFWNDKVGLVEK